MPLNETMAALEIPTAKGFFRLRVRDVRAETRDAIAVTFDVPPGLEKQFAFAPGQHLTLRQEIAGEVIRRSYSICAAVQDKTLRIAIKRMPDGIFSNWANDRLAIGDHLEVMPPTGKFGVPLSSQNQRTYAAFAAGSGITPIFSILKSTLLAEPQSNFTLFFGNRATGTVMFRDELADLKDRFLERLNLVHILTRERQESELLNGRISREKAQQLLNRWFGDRPIDVAFLCGPDTLIPDVAEALKLRGLAESQIRRELFTSGLFKPRTRVRSHPEQKLCEVTLLLDGAAHRFSMPRGSESILHAGLRHGIDIRYGCQGGVCSSCRGHLRAGEVEMDAHYALEDYEVAQGFILTCQSHPLTDQVTVDFDRVH
jgi:ring-1,2-phenylacetyl-CoA epoxidase subunit PaaE